MSTQSNVVTFNRKPVIKSLKEKGLQDFVKIINEKAEQNKVSNIFAIFYNKEEDSYEVFEVGDYRLNELLGDLELLKDFIKSGE
jgi:hypothetical protein